MAGLPIYDFIKARLKEADPNFELRPGTAFEQLFLKPLSFILQPLRSEADDIQISQSALRIMSTADPDAFNEEAVDSIASNVFVYRVDGGYSYGIVRVYYNKPVDREWPVSGASFLGADGQTFYNSTPYAITASEMGAQIDGGFYFLDIPVVSSLKGSEGNVPAGGIVTMLGDTAAVSVTNREPFQGGVSRETNTQLINRTKRSIAVRDLVTTKGINAILFEAFPTAITELQPVGFGDVEMMRDIMFNTHVGGKVDVYIKTPTVKTTFKDFVGLLVDTTRQARALVSVQMIGAGPISLRNPNIDRTGNLNPVVTQIRPATSATFISTVDLSTRVNLSGPSGSMWVKIGIDGNSRDVKLSGVQPASTQVSEIITAINRAFGVSVATPSGSSIKLTSPSRGRASEIYIADPSSPKESALQPVFGLTPGSAYTYSGDGPLTFLETVHFSVDDADGTISRVIGDTVVPSTNTGVTEREAFTTTSGGVTTTSYKNTNRFGDPTTVGSSSGAFVSVQVNDILTIPVGDPNYPHPDAGDYRIVQKLGNTLLVLDAILKNDGTYPKDANGNKHGLYSNPYYITRTGIKNGEVVSAEYWFNPLSIDVGKNIKQDELGRVRSIRTGRELATITDLAFLRINSIELIDPLTLEPLEKVLEGVGGYGSGGYGLGPYGIGNKKDYYLTVNEPSARYSAFEDSFIVINSAYQGYSFRVSYDYVPEVLSVHDFVRSESERVLDGDILIKHFIPAYVNGTIEYRVDPSASSSVPDNDELLLLLKEFINTQKVGSTLEYSDLSQFIVRKTDPFDRYGTFIKPFTLKATIYNTDGSTTILSGKDRLEVVAPSPFPKSTTRPISPKIVHWVADNFTLVRIS